MNLDLLAAVLPSERRVEINRKCVLIMWSQSLNAAALEVYLPTGLFNYLSQFSFPPSLLS